MSDESEEVDPTRVDDGDTVKYLVLQDRGEFVIELPSHWKLTFGAVNPGAPPHGRDLHCLRVWGGTNSKTAPLRGVFCDVRGFRDLSLPLARKVTKETGSAEWTHDSEGNFDRRSMRQLESRFDADDVSSDVPF